MAKNVKGGKLPFLRWAVLHSLSSFSLTHRPEGKVRVAARYGWIAQAQTSSAPVLEKYKYSLRKPWSTQAVQLNGRIFNVLIIVDIWQYILPLFICYLHIFSLKTLQNFNNIFVHSVQSTQPLTEHGSIPPFLFGSAIQALCVSRLGVSV